MNTVKDLLNNEDIVNCIVEDITEVPEDAEVTYELWAIGYDCYDEVTDTEVLIGEFEDPDTAVIVANRITLEDVVNQLGTDITDDVAYFSIEVETVIEDEDDSTMNIGTIFKKELRLATEDEGYTQVVFLTNKDYELLEDGALKVKCSILSDYNKNDNVTFFFVGENDGTSILTYKIVSRVIYADGDYYHCEFVY